MPDELVITDMAGLEACMARVKECPRLGMDTEFVGEDTYHPKLCLIQIATPDTLYLVDPFAFADDELGPLWKLLVDPARLLIVHAGREEVRLCRRGAGVMPANLFDLQIAAGLVGLTYPLGHGNLVGLLLNQQLSKGETLTEWRTRPLTKAQLRYAFDDVRYLLALWTEINSRLTQLGRGEWATEEFARLCADSRPIEPGETPSNEKWRRLRGAGTLDRRRLAMLRELFQWRDEEAAKSNRPSRTILRDDLLIEIVRRNPKVDQDIAVIRGLARRYALPIWHAIERARALPAEALPTATEREQDPVQFNLIVNVLGAALADFCQREKLASNLVAAGQDLKLLVRAKLLGQPIPDGSLLAHGWRATHILPHLQAILEGRRSVTIGNVQSETPFTYRDEQP